MPPTDAEVREVVRRVLARVLDSAREGDGLGRVVIDEEAVRAAHSGTSLRLPEGALVTPLARQMAVDRKVTLETGKPGSQPNSGRGVATQLKVAIGADHGGYPLKETLLPHLRSLGYHVVDCGTHSADPVDYPDIAYAVARLVATGECANGIVIDGAGIGSCMAANKVPGVRAALCYDHASAVNSREHNHANVLTLGAGLIGSSLAKQIVSTWLATPFGGDRHARRVEKITAIEKRHLK